MIIYSETKDNFLQDILESTLTDKILSSLKIKAGMTVGLPEIRAYRNSLQFMNNVLADAEIPSDSRVSIEYKIPQTGKRIDFILTGKDSTDRSSAIIVELKQWERAELTEMDGVVKTFINGYMQEKEHPSYQAWSYAALLEDFNEEVQTQNIQLKPCAYLHNYEQDGIIDNEFYDEYITKAPLFLKSDAIKLRDFIKQFIKHGDKNDIMFQIDHGRIRPSKNLADKLVSLMEGNQEFIMIDDQKIVYETAKKLAKESTAQNKHVLVVEGGPGTGKSVVAINLLVALIKDGLTTQYVTKNAAPRAVYESKLTGNFKKSHITNLFSGSGAYTTTDKNLFDALIVDEAHRLNEKSGLFSNLGENQIKEIISASKFSLFFIDEDQKVTLKDIGDKEEINKFAKQLNAKVYTLSLTSQFRCNGSDGYVAWLDNVLQIHETANDDFGDFNFDFQIVDSPSQLRDMIFEKNKIHNKARMVAGYCWDWKTKNDNNKDLYDFELEDGKFKMRWNLSSDSSLWMIKPNSVNEIGVIHTSQGLDIDYIGVIVGPDLVVRDGKVKTNPTKRSSQDSSIKGYKQLLKDNPEEGMKKVDQIIKNTYRTLMTRGMKGCYVYFTDEGTKEYFKDKIVAGVKLAVAK